MKTLHVFGKRGCGKCAIVKRRCQEISEKHGIELIYHDCSTEEGLVEFCLAKLNPNTLPAVIVGDMAGYVLAETKKSESHTFPFLGCCTNYNGSGVISTEQIEELLQC